jgi:hypothetical protein
MLFHGHTPVVAYEIHMAGLDPPRREIPAARITHIGILNLPPVDKKLPLAELDLLSLQGNDPFQKHDLHSGQSYDHDIASLRLRESVPQSPAEIEFAVVIRWLHAGSSYSQGNAHLREQSANSRAYRYVVCAFHSSFPTWQT